MILRAGRRKGAGEGEVEESLGEKSVLRKKKDVAMCIVLVLICDVNVQSSSLIFFIGLDFE